MRLLDVLNPLIQWMALQFKCCMFNVPASAFPAALSRQINSILLEFSDIILQMC